MRRILIPTFGPTDWRKLLAEPDAQWKRGRSALELAVSWECAQRTERGIPTAVAYVLDQRSSLAGCRLLLALPEHRVTLKGRGKASQTDVWVLLRAGHEYISMAVEGKAGEPFGPTLEEWLTNSSDGKRERLKGLCEILQLTTPPVAALRYQLLHRAASALLEAQRFGAQAAVMLVQSFQIPDRDDADCWSDFAKFCAALGTTAARGALAEAQRVGSERLLLGWADCSVASDREIAGII